MRSCEVTHLRDRLAFACEDLKTGNSQPMLLIKLGMLKETTYADVVFKDKWRLNRLLGMRLGYTLSEKLPTDLDLRKNLLR